MKIKRIGRITLVTALMMSFALNMIISSCSDYDYSDSPDPLNLDSNLYGTWSITSESGTASWTFNSDGTCIETLYSIDYDWKWEIVDGQIKLYVDSGIPAYKTYKIEGDLLYLWVDSMSIWGLPFTKQ